jgi:hypothetical protein
MFNLTKKNENFRDAYLYKNMALTFGLRDNRTLNETSFTANFFNTYGYKIKQLRTTDIFVDGTYVGLDNFRINSGIPVSLLQYRMLKGIVETAIVRYRKHVSEEQNTVEIATFVNRSKRGSKRFRKILSSYVADYIPHNIIKFRDNVDVIVGLPCAKKLNACWNNNIFNNSTRTFLFKLYNNTLGYNNAVAHFVRNHSPNCTFCDIAGVQEIFNETPLHLFFSCTTTETFINDMFKWFMDDNTFEFSRTEFFTLFERQAFANAKNVVLTVFSKLLLKFLWDSKQRHTLPCTVHGRILISTEITSMTETSRKFKKLFQNSGFGTNFVL